MQNTINKSSTASDTPVLKTYVEPAVSLMRTVKGSIGSLLRFGRDRTPQRTYFFSDAYGGAQEWNPFEKEDMDVLISTDFSGRPTATVHRECDTFGHERVTDHYLRLIMEQFDEQSKRTDLSRRTRKRARSMGTGVFINYAPRISRGNASPFWIATARGGDIRIVATPIESLSPIRDEIESLAYLPNPQQGDPSNGLYDSKQQFRSKLTPILLNPDHGLETVDINPSIIPPFRFDWHVSYVDRYGNVITRVEDVEAQWNEIERAAHVIEGTRRSVRIAIGASNPHDFMLGSSLGSAKPGAPTIYRNGQIDLVRKWEEGDDADVKIRESAFNRTGRPTIGTPISIA